MKKIALAMVLAGFSFGAMAAATGDACTGTAAGTATGAPGTNEFIKAEFTPKCSANTFVSFSQTATAIGVGSASIKGKNRFGGSSEGGGVTQRGACSASPCAQGDASGAATTALSS